MDRGEGGEAAAAGGPSQKEAQDRKGSDETEVGVAGVVGVGVIPGSAGKPRKRRSDSVEALSCKWKGIVSARAYIWAQGMNSCIGGQMTLLSFIQNGIG